MRVIAGEAGGIRLSAPRDPGVRPITDRVKETLFAILGERVPDAVVLDLYAGSGAIGIEALSRGAERAVFVERGRDALTSLRQNLDRTRLAGRAEIHAEDVMRFLRREPSHRYDLVLLDPPYAERAILAPLELLMPHLAAGATVVVKHFWRTEMEDTAGLRPLRTRRFGETALTFLQRSDGGRIMSRVAIFPGSFDPMTNAHLDVARRAAVLFDRLVIGVLHNPRKQPLFDVGERVELIRASVADFGDHVSVTAFDGLTVDLARKQGAGFIVRGLRATSDFEAELQMAHTNRKLAPAVDTTFLMTALEFGYLSSTLAKEIARFGGELGGMVPEPVETALRERFADGV